MKKRDMVNDANFHFKNIKRWDGGTMVVCEWCTETAQDLDDQFKYECSRCREYSETKIPQETDVQTVLRRRRVCGAA